MAPEPPRERLRVRDLAEQGGKLRRGAMLLGDSILYEVRGLLHVEGTSRGEVDKIKLVDVRVRVPVARDDDALLGEWVPFERVAEFEVIRAAG